MRHDLLFETDRFNLSQERENFINPCCFGEDLAGWLRGKLAERGAKASEPAQEDWGWYLGADYEGHSYFIGIGGNADEGRGGNYGEWRIMVEEPQSLWARLTKKKTPTPEKMFALIRSIVESEPGFTNVRLDE